MEHTLYILEKERNGGIKDLILGLAKHLDATTQIRDVLVVETDDARLAGMACVLAAAGGELLDLVSAQDLRQPSGLMTREAVEAAWFGEDRLPDGPALEAIEKGEGRLLILTNEDHAETHGDTPPVELVKTAATWNGELEALQPGDTVYLPTGEIYRPQQPAEPGENALPPWVDLKTATCYENTELQRLVKEGEFEAGRRFGHREIGVHVVVNRGLEFFLEPVKKIVPAGDLE